MTYRRSSSRVASCGVELERDDIQDDEPEGTLGGKDAELLLQLGEETSGQSQISVASTLGDAAPSNAKRKLTSAVAPTPKPKRRKAGDPLAGWAIELVPGDKTTAVTLPNTLKRSRRNLRHSIHNTLNICVVGKYQSKLGVGANREGVKVSGSKAGVAIASSSSLSAMTGLLLKAGLGFGGGWRGWRPFNSGSRDIPQWRMFLVRSLFRDAIGLISTLDF
ncbi:hypothetical protein B0H13DRAFT_1864786 [Mycena leptocephala]|nr:hypothetical protein B0H13DRAFT_1864786 [Mycena leptocephala]